MKIDNGHLSAMNALSIVPFQLLPISKIKSVRSKENGCGLFQYVGWGWRGHCNGACGWQRRYPRRLALPMTRQID